MDCSHMATFPDSERCLATRVGTAHRLVHGNWSRYRRDPWGNTGGLGPSQAQSAWRSKGGRRRTGSSIYTTRYITLTAHQSCEKTHFSLPLESNPSTLAMYQ